MEDQQKTVASSLCNLENRQTAWDSPILLRGNQYLISRGDAYMPYKKWQPPLLGPLFQTDTIGGRKLHGPNIKVISKEA